MPLERDNKPRSRPDGPGTRVRVAVGGEGFPRRERCFASTSPSQRTRRDRGLG